MAATGPDRYRGLARAITRSLEDESDRGKALIIGSYLEEIVAFLISSVCVSENLAEKLLGHQSPAGTFRAKIVLASALGLIDQEEVGALRVVQRIRNKAAHFDSRRNVSVEVEFRWSSHSSQVEQFATSFGVSLSATDDDELGEAFVVASRMLAVRLLSRGADIRRPDPPLSLRERAERSQKQLEGTPLGELLANAKRRAKEGDHEVLVELLGALGFLHDHDA